MAKERKSAEMMMDVDFSAVHNRNEVRVRKELSGMFSELPAALREPKAIQDIYALTLNSLPSRYTQPGSIVLRDPVRVEHIREAIREAVKITAQRRKE